MIEVLNDFSPLVHGITLYLGKGEKLGKITVM